MRRWNQASGSWKSTPHGVKTRGQAGTTLSQSETTSAIDTPRRASVEDWRLTSASFDAEIRLRHGGPFARGVMRGDDQRVCPERHIRLQAEVESARHPGLRVERLTPLYRR